ncbi:predicted protein [Nematostella vectensis]|uniref:Protein-lysine N-trimethyltransferase SMYD5 n=2 Tax=Nematostella vectensis TaxID=45351 RepID=A7SMV6_NEMVE|nr:predicted protein [Nematostella vectensis]|eukprot:XP_001627062.1 predicted protein [Nematostella vectensis]
MDVTQSGFIVKETDSERGRALFASRDFKEGDTIFEEDPLVCSQFLWNAAYSYTACDHCMRSLETAQDMARRLSSNPTLELPYSAECCAVTKAGEPISYCPQCNVAYCSENCRIKALDQYHRILCLGTSTPDPNHPLVKLQETWKNIHYPPETANIMLIARIMATILQATNSDVKKGSFSHFCSNVVNKEQQIAHKLLGLHFQEQLDMIRILLSEAMYDDRLEQWFTPEGFSSLFALVGTNGQGIGTSSLSLYVHNIDSYPALSDDERQAIDIFLNQLYEEMERVSGQFLNCEGAGLYALQSSCNHSCAPNAEVTFPKNNSTLVLKALHPIKNGEEICISYLEECQRERSRHSRLKYLRENYIFDCTCTKCELQANEPDESSSDGDDEHDDE